MKVINRLNEAGIGKQIAIPHDIESEVSSKFDKELLHLPQISSVAMRVEKGEFTKRVFPEERERERERERSWFKREQIMKTRTREQTWSLDQFKWHFCNSETTGPPPAPTGPPPAPTTGPPPV
ncbi:hypothetical protein LXL04_018153 [Taraxacum kok-saghyz]